MWRPTRALGWILILMLCVPTVAFAATEAQLKTQLDELKANASAAGRKYSRAYWALDETEAKLNTTNRRIKTTRVALTAARARLGQRVAGIYRREDLDTLGFIVGATSFEQLVTRFELVSRIGEADARAVKDVKRLRERLLTQRRALVDQRVVRQKDVKKLKSERAALQRRLDSTDAEYRRVRTQLDAVRGGGTVAAGVASAPGPNGMVFPVAGSNYYSDTWGASRSGGRRRHQGTDIMAARGTRCVAIMSGTVRVSNGGLGGRTIWLTADNGWLFYYAHLDRQIVTGGRVRAGQVIGTVGSTGNAQGGSPHLHFQVHPRGGSPVNPYRYLRAME